jgi:hypothetical protein
MARSRSSPNERARVTDDTAAPPAAFDDAAHGPVQRAILGQITALAIDGPLALVEDESAIYVVQEDDPNDWLVRFEKDGSFPAASWAYHMVAVYNDRLSEQGGSRSRWDARPPGWHVEEA